MTTVPASSRLAESLDDVPDDVDSLSDEPDADDGDGASSMTESLLPPPTETYGSEEACFHAVKDWAGKQGYSLSKSGKAKQNPRGETYLRVLRCTRGGKRPTNPHGVRPGRGSRKTGCPMGIIIAAVQPSDPHGPWTVRHQRGRRSFMHNHGPSPAQEFPDQRRLNLTREQLSVIQSHRIAGIQPKKTLDVLLRDDPSCLLTVRDIRNAQNAERLLQRMEGRPPGDSVSADAPPADNAFFRYTMGDDLKISSFFLVSTEGRKLFARNPDVLIVDWTHKTNSNGLSIVDINGVNDDHRDFQVALALVSNDREEDFSRILENLREFLGRQRTQVRLFITDQGLALVNALHKIFPDIPQMLCQGHLNEDVLTYARRYVAPRSPQ